MRTSLALVIVLGACARRAPPPPVAPVWTSHVRLALDSPAAIACDAACDGAPLCLQRCAGAIRESGACPHEHRADGWACITFEHAPWLCGTPERN